MKSAFSRGSAALLVIVLGAVACERSSSTEPTLNHLSHEPSAAASPTAVANAGLVKVVHGASARYHATAQAARDGYAEDPFCVEHPTLGGMGHHWANFALVDDVFDPGTPEVVLYAPDRHGRMKLAAVEYLVLDVGQPAPTFAGQPFDVGGAPIPVPHWSLHVWLFKPNPAGLFTPFNPDVDCP